MTEVSEGVNAQLEPPRDTAGRFAPYARQATEGALVGDFPVSRFGTFKYPDFRAFDGTAEQWIEFIEQAEIDDETIDAARKAYAAALKKEYLKQAEEVDFQFNNDPRVVALMKSRGWDKQLEDRLRKEKHDALNEKFDAEWPYDIPPQFARQIVRWVQAIRLRKVAAPDNWHEVESHRVQLSLRSESTPRALWDKYHAATWIDAI